MTVHIRRGDVRDRLREIPSNSVDCIVTSWPFWGQRHYLPADHVDKPLEIGLEPTLGEHIATLTALGAELFRILKPTGTFWWEYGDCYATTPNGRPAEEQNNDGTDNRTFRDKPFSTVGPIHGEARRGKAPAGKGDYSSPRLETAMLRGGGVLKPKDLCLVPSRLAIALHDQGWYVRARNVWAKASPMPDSRGTQRPSGTAYSEVFLFAKTGDHYYDHSAVMVDASPNTHSRVARDKPANGSRRANGGTRSHRPMKAVLMGVDRGLRASMENRTGIVPRRLLRNCELAPPGTEPEPFGGEIWRLSGRGFSDGHFATFPLDLAERCILAGSPPGGVVLDPFGGAGTVGLASQRHGRDAILIELVDEYIAIAQRRLAADRKQREVA